MTASGRCSRWSLLLFFTAASATVSTACGQGDSPSCSSANWGRSVVHTAGGRLREPSRLLSVSPQVPQWYPAGTAMPPACSAPVWPAPPLPPRPVYAPRPHFQRLPPVAPSEKHVRGLHALPPSFPLPSPSNRGCSPGEFLPCPDQPRCADSDACLQHSLPPQDLYDTAYRQGGVQTFIRIFEAAAARGIENAAIRAFNSTSVCPTCQHQNAPPHDCAQPSPAAAAPGGHFRDEPSQVRQQFELLNHSQARDPRQLAQLQIRRDVVTGTTTMIDEAGNRVQVDPRSLPPQGIWWSTTNGRLETADTRGKSIAFGDPRSPGFRFQNLVAAFRVELEEATKRVIMTHKQSGRSFTFDPRP